MVLSTIPKGRIAAIDSASRADASRKNAVSPVIAPNAVIVPTPGTAAAAPTAPPEPVTAFR